MASVAKASGLATSSLLIETNKQTIDKPLMVPERAWQVIKEMDNMGQKKKS